MSHFARALLLSAALAASTVLVSDGEAFADAGDDDELQAPADLGAIEAIRTARRIFAEACVEKWHCAIVPDGPFDGTRYVWITIYPDEESAYEADAPSAQACVVIDRRGRVIDHGYAACEYRIST